jgi:hypothetical protein
LYSAYSEPSVDVTATEFETFEITKTGTPPVPTSVTLKLKVTITVDNPSKKPIEFTLKSIDAYLYSLDIEAADDTGTPLPIGSSTLESEAEVKAESVTDLVMLGETDSTTGGDPALAQRLFRDCGPTGTQTRIRVHILKAVVSVYGIEVEPSNIEQDFSISCAGLAS